MSVDDDFIVEDEFTDDDVELRDMLEASEEAENTSRSEWLSFAILAAIMVGTIAVVWLVSPVIFNRIVPAVMGANIVKVDDPITETENGATTEEATNEEAPESAEGNTETGEEGSVDESTSGVETEEAAEGDAENTEVESATEETIQEGTEPAIAIQTLYVVKSGDTLAAIARLYGVSIESIAEANDISNPSLVKIGEELKIPEK